MKDKVVTFLKNKKRKFCVLASVDSTNKPHASSMKFAVMDDGTIVLTTHKHTKKWNNLMKNPNVSLVFGMDFEDLYVQMDGKALIVENESEGKKFSDFYCLVHPFAADITSSPEVVFIAVSPTWIRVTDFSLQPVNVQEISL